MSPLHIHAFLHPKACPTGLNSGMEYHLVPPAWLAVALAKLGHTVTWGPEAPENYDVALVSDVGSWGEPHPGKPVLYYLDDAGLTPRGDVPKKWVILADNRATLEQQEAKGYATYQVWPGFDPDVFKPLGMARQHLIGFRGRPSEGTYYTGRERCLKALKERLSVKFVTSWSGDCENWEQGGKQWTCDRLNAWRNRFYLYFLHTYDGEKGYSPHLVEALASGCIVFHNRTPGYLERRFPWCVPYETSDDLCGLIDGYATGQFTISERMPEDSYRWLIENGHTWRDQAKVALHAIAAEGLA